MAELETILSLLPKLNQEDLLKVRTALDTLARSAPKKSGREAELLYGILEKYFKEMGIGPVDSYQTVIRRNTNTILNRAISKINEFLLTQEKTLVQAQRLALYWALIDISVEYCRQRGLLVDARSTLYRIAEPASLLEYAFPGYVKAGLLTTILSRPMKFMESIESD